MTVYGRVSRMIMRLYIPFFSCLIVFATTHALAEIKLGDQHNVIFNRLGTRDGLSQGTVSAITQDKNGFIWIGTQEGLNRYDGYSFEAFFHISDEPTSISHHNVFDILSDSSGTLWVGTDSGLNRFNEASKTFEVFHLNSDTNLIDRDKVYSLFEDSKKQLWIGSGIGLTVRSQDGLFTHFHSDLMDETSIGAGSVRAVFEDSRGYLWVGTEFGGLYRLDQSRGSFEAVDLALHDSYVRSIIEDDEGNLWVSTHNGGVRIFNPDTGYVRSLIHDKDDPTSLSANRVRVMLKDRRGAIWVGTDEGLNLWQPEEQNFFHFTHDATSTSSLSDNVISEIYQDAGGVIWIGTFNGISKWNTEIATFPHFRHHADREGSIASNAIASFAEGQSDEVWIGTFNGLNKWDSSSGTFIHYSAKEIGLSDNRIMSLETQGDILWVGTMSGGVNLVRSGKVISTFSYDESDTTSISSNAITSVFEDSSGNIWLSTYGGGINKYLGNDRFERYLPETKDTSGRFQSLIAHDIAEAPDGSLWIATDGSGVVVMNPLTGRTVIHQNRENDPTSLSSNNVVSLLVADGVIWVGTRDTGMNRYNPDTNRFDRFSKTDGLASDSVWGILEDANGKLWISGAKGVTVYNPHDKTFVLYDPTHGLQSDDFNSGAYLKLSDGSFLFGGNNGFNAFYPERIMGNPYVPPVKITRFTKFNEVVTLLNPVYQSSTINLEYTDSVIGFEFAAMDFTAPAKNRFRYQLEGFNRDWVEAKNEHLVTYTNLDAGEYTFRVSGSNNDGVWNDIGTAINIVVSPPIWATWWAYLVYLLIGIGVLYQAQKANELRLRREAEKRYNERLQLYIESLEEATDCVLIADADMHLMYANNAIKSILGNSPIQAVGRSIFSLLFSDSADANLASTGLRSNGRWHGEVRSRKGTKYLTTDITIAAVHDDDKKVSAFVSIARDVTDRKKTEAELEKHRVNLQQLVDARTKALQHEVSENKAVQRELANSLKEKELLIKEVHHRVKNNMQVISSLLNIQAETVGDDLFSGLLGDSQQRIKSMSLIHETLYQSENLAEIDFTDYINMLANSLHRFYSVQGVTVTMDIQVDDVALDIETAVPCGLIINELISNSLKHGFVGREERGTIRIHFRIVDWRYVLEISDDGVGLPQDFSLESTSSMGMEIVSILTKQLDGELQYKSIDGAWFEISFPRRDKNVDEIAVSR